MGPTSYSPQRSRRGRSEDRALFRALDDVRHSLRPATEPFGTFLHSLRAVVDRDDALLRVASDEVREPVGAPEFPEARLARSPEVVEGPVLALPASLHLVKELPEHVGPGVVAGLVEEPRLVASDLEEVAQDASCHRWKWNPEVELLPLPMRCRHVPHGHSLRNGLRARPRAIEVDLAPLREQRL